LKKKGEIRLEVAHLQRLFPVQLTILFIALLKLSGVLNSVSPMESKEGYMIL
jgi:hypothetical protein